MLIKNIFRIVASYKFALIKIIFFEIVCIFNLYKGNSFSFSNNNVMADNIPCPYYFLLKIKKVLKKYDFDTLVDLGCGSGRAIDFFDKNFPKKKFIGIEYFKNQYERCVKKFKKKNNILIKQEDFTKYDFIQYNANCYFFNNPFKNDKDVIPIIKHIKKNQIKEGNILFIFINFNKDTFEELKDLKKIEKYYINKDKGFSLYLLDLDKKNE